MCKLHNIIMLLLGVTIALFISISAYAGTEKEVRPYTEAEKKMLEETNKAADERVGWKKIGKWVASRDSIKRWGNNIDYWNPLWDDEEYAVNTRYGDIIAAPAYLPQRLAGEGMDMVVNSGVGTWQPANKGGLDEYFKPIRPGDVIRVWQDRPIIEDVTEGDGPRTFNITTSWSFINQNDELVYRFTMYLSNSFNSSGKNASSTGEAGFDGNTVRRGLQMSEQTVYTDEDWKMIDNIAAGEEIRGAKIRYWEDVNVGDEPKWVIAEPTTVIDMIKLGGEMTMDIPPIRELKRDAKGVSKDKYGVYHQMIEGHYNNYSEGGAGRAIHFMAFGESVMSRLVTNWMGDDGWMKKLDWSIARSDDVIKEVKGLKDKEIVGGHGSDGDAVISKAEVVNKYVENGEHLVDLLVWTESLSGKVWQFSKATVKLISREDPIKWK